jgi:hypothetical protein
MRRISTVSLKDTVPMTDAHGGLSTLTYPKRYSIVIVAYEAIGRSPRAGTRIP